MIDDPYKVLGLAPNASQDEVKKAYRQMAKKYHPDLHPNDPAAAQKMNEVNEAYDMLMNPEKYAARRAQQQQQQSRPSGYYGQQSQGQSYQQHSTGYRGPGGWASDFEDFGFGFGFGFGGAQQQTAPGPRPEASDSPDIQRAVRAINESRYPEAVSILTNIPSTGRNARWYYLSALANEGMGNSVQALDHIQKAARLDPENRTYLQLLQKLRQAGQTYEHHAQGFNMQAVDMQKICCGCLAVQFLCGPFSFIRCY